MRLPSLIYKPLFNVLYKRIGLIRRPDEVIGHGGPYMLRWFLFGRASKPNKRGQRGARRIFGCTIYLHCFVRSDDDRALHDHPSNFASLILRGSYDEHTKLPPIQMKDYAIPRTKSMRYNAGSLRFGKADTPHRIQLLPQDFNSDLIAGRNAARETCLLSWDYKQHADRELDYKIGQLWRLEKPVWTLFYLGPWKRDWGFHCPDGWKFWRDFDKDVGCPARGTPAPITPDVENENNV